MILYCTAYLLTCLQGPFYNVVPLRVELQYPHTFDTLGSSNWMPRFGLLDLGVMEPRTRLGIGTSFGEEYAALEPGGISIGSFLPIHVYWAPFLHPYSIGPLQTASMLLLSVSFNLGTLDHERDVAARRYADLNLTYQPGPAIAVRAGYLVAASRTGTGSTLYGGLELKYGGWFRRHAKTAGRPTDMRVRDVRRFMNRLEEKITPEYENDARLAPIKERVDSFQTSVLKRLTGKERRAMVTMTMVPTALVCGFWTYGGYRKFYVEEYDENVDPCIPMLECMAFPICGTVCLDAVAGWAALLAACYGNVRLSDTERALVESIVEDYNRVTNEFPAEGDSLLRPR